MTTRDDILPSRAAKSSPGQPITALTRRKSACNFTCTTTAAEAAARNTDQFLCATKRSETGLLFEILVCAERGENFENLVCAKRGEIFEVFVRAEKILRFETEVYFEKF